MKDAKHHLRHLQKKVIQSSKKETVERSNPTLSNENRMVDFKRPKIVPNKRKTA